MKHRALYSLLFALFSAAAAFGADDLLGQAIKVFRYPVYDAQGNLKMEIAGEEALALPGELIQISKLNMNFYEKGQKTMHISTPFCLYDRSKQRASSTADVCVTRAEIIITGRGFHWDEKEEQIRINSKVKVIVEKTGQKPLMTYRPSSNSFKAESDTNCAVITSARLHFDQKKRTAVFDGHVNVNDAELKINSDYLTVFFTNDKKVEVIEAEGNVAISRNAIKAYSRRAAYLVSAGKATLTGNPFITSDQNSLSGGTIVFWRDSNRILCEPDAHLVLYSEQKMRNEARNN
jgi:lipopolysaccharide transport protein LptA